MHETFVSATALVLPCHGISWRVAAPLERKVQHFVRSWVGRSKIVWGGRKTDSDARVWWRVAWWKSRILTYLIQTRSLCLYLSFFLTSATMASIDNSMLSRSAPVKSNNKSLQIIFVSLLIPSPSLITLLLRLPGVLQGVEDWSWLHLYHHPLSIQLYENREEAGFHYIHRFPVESYGR